MRKMPALLVTLALFLAPAARAGGLENFAPCSKSNDCKSKQCFDKKCEPSMQWNGHGVIGSECTNDGNCESHTCKSRRCVAAPAKTVDRPTSVPRGSTREVETPTPPPRALNACAKKIVAMYTKGSGDDMYDTMAANVCDDFDAATIDRAIKLDDAHYGVGLEATCRAIAGRSDADVDCGKKAFDKLVGEARDTSFKIPVSCTTTQTPEEIERCVKEVKSTPNVALGSDAEAQYACTTYDARTIRIAEKAKKTGYGGTFLFICDSMNGRSDAEIACARQKYEALWEKSMWDVGIFGMDEECEVHKHP